MKIRVRHFRFSILLIRHFLTSAVYCNGILLGKVIGSSEEMAKPESLGEILRNELQQCSSLREKYTKIS